MCRVEDEKLLESVSVIFMKTGRHQSKREAGYVNMWSFSRLLECLIDEKVWGVKFPSLEIKQCGG